MLLFLVTAIKHVLAGQPVWLRSTQEESLRGRAGVPSGGIPVTRHHGDTRRGILGNIPCGFLFSATTCLFLESQKCEE